MTSNFSSSYWAGFYHIGYKHRLKTILADSGPQISHTFWKSLVWVENISFLWHYLISQIYKYSLLWDFRSLSSVILSFTFKKLKMSYYGYILSPRHLNIHFVAKNKVIHGFHMWLSYKTLLLHFYLFMLFSPPKFYFTTFSLRVSQRWDFIEKLRNI